jgi:hypothetical protein
MQRLPERYPAIPTVQEQYNPTQANPIHPDLNQALWWSTTRPAARMAQPSAPETPDPDARAPDPTTPAPDLEARPTA